MSLKRSIAVATFPLRNGLMEILRMRGGFLGKSGRIYQKQILESGMFDAAWYRARRPRCWAARFLPLRHFILRGERMGIDPGPKFDIEAYLHANPDVLRLGLAPFRHYLEHGRAEHRRLRVSIDHPPAMPGLEPPEIDVPPITGRPIAVAVHLYYFELWDEIHRQLSNLHLAFDLYVTLTRRQGHEEARRRILADRPDAKVWDFPNHGRDIFPFIHLLNSGVFAPYRAVCKLHGKRSTHRKDGDSWRGHLVSSLLPPDGRAEALAWKLLDDPTLGIVAAEGQVFKEPKHWGLNQWRCRELLEPLDIHIHQKPLCFPGGSMFWVTQPVLEALRGLQLPYWRFEPEHGQLDGTFAHAVERAFGLIAVARGFRVESSEDILRTLPQPS